jgi:hypothetical protein
MSFSILVLLSLILSLGNLLGMWLISRHRTSYSGWIFLITWQLPWSAYDIWTHQYGFLLLSPVTVVIAVRAITRSPVDSPEKPG